MTRPARTVRVNPDVERWNRRYAITPGSVAECVEARGEEELVAHEQLLGRKGKALELACGRGRNALYLASLGYDVIAADCALNGLKSCQASSEHLALSVYPVACDLKSYRFPQKCFDLVSVVRFLHRPLFTELINWLRPGGLLFYKTFSKSFLSINPGFNPDYLVEPGELISAFSGMELLASDLDFGDFAEDPKTGTSFILARKTAPGG